MKIGFIGLGHMGAPMALNLLKAGHTLSVFDLSETAMQTLADAGAQRAASPKAAASGAQWVVTMLPAAAHVRSVLTSEDGVLAGVAKGVTIIDSSTIDPASAREFAALAAARGNTFVDAPVSGGTGGAEAGTLAFMCGGSDKAFARAEPILQKMGKRIVHAGGAGAGQAAKICNNMLLAISMIGTCEAFVLGEKLGLDHKKLFDIMSAASGQCWSLTTYCPVPGPVPASPSNREFTGGFATALMLKDLKLSQQAAQNAGAATPMGAEALQLYALMAAKGKAGMDFSGIIEMLRGVL